MSAHPISSVALLLAYQWPQFCTNCNRTCTHGVYGTVSDGLAEECFGCGEKKVAEFTRMHTEV